MPSCCLCVWHQHFGKRRSGPPEYRPKDGVFQTGLHYECGPTCLDTDTDTLHSNLLVWAFSLFSFVPRSYRLADLLCSHLLSSVKSFHPHRWKCPASQTSSSTNLSLMICSPCRPFPTRLVTLLALHFVHHSGHEQHTFSHHCKYPVNYLFIGSCPPCLLSWVPTRILAVSS